MPPLFSSSDLDRHLQLLHRAADHVGDQGGPVRGLARVKDQEPPRRAVDQVDDVVQPGGEEVDVLPVQRGDEHPVEPGHHLVGHLVGLVL